MFTQAFLFEFIRLLEGYWPTDGGLGRLRRWRTRRQRSRKQKLAEELRRLQRRALWSTRADLKKLEQLGSGGFDALESYIAGDPMLESCSEADQEHAADLVEKWMKYADPEQLVRIEDLEERIGEYPTSQHRILPTRLGNIVRSAEERIHDERDGRLENLVLHVLDQLPPTIASSFREQRRRLDLYCGLVFVLGGAVAPAIGVSFSIRDDQPVAAVALPASFVITAFISYHAAIASGRKLALALDAIQEQRKGMRAGEPRLEPEAPAPS